MKDFNNLCMNCFEELNGSSVCQGCDYDNDTFTDTMYLQPKTVLNERYVIGALVEHESDAAVYMAYDMELDAVARVREFLPKGIANRLEGNSDVHIRERYRASYQSYKASFIKLWTTITKMHNLSAVVQTYDVFECNETAYAVSENLESVTLRDFLLKSPNGNVSWDKARLMFMPVLTTLEALHANGIVHGGICPDNLILCRDGKVRLNSICISEANNFKSDLQFNEHEGYTALEQYDNNHKICPATDIYAFSACIFRALVGQNPPSSVSRETNDKLMIPNTVAENIPTHIIRALGGGLQVYPEKRTQSVDVFREHLNASPSVVAASAKLRIEGDEPEPEEREHKKSEDYKQKNKQDVTKTAIIILVVLIIVAAIAGGIFAAKSGILNKPEETTTPTTELTKYTVPDFVTSGYTQSDIQNNGAWNKQFKFSFNTEFSKDIDEGIIFKQSVPAGEEVDEGSEIVLTISKGVETAEVIDVGGLPLDEAQKILTEAGFKVSTVEIYNDTDNTPNTVKSTFGMAPAAGEVVAKGEEIILQVYGEKVTTTQPTTEKPTELD